MRNHKSSKSSIKTLLGFTAPHKGWAVVRIAGAVVLAAVDILLAYIILQTVEAALSGDRQQLNRALLLMGISILTGIVCSYGNRYSGGRLSACTVRDIRSRVVSHVQDLPLSYMDQNNSGQILSRLTSDINMMQNFLENDLPNLVFQPLRFLGAFVYMLLINWKLLLFCVAMMPLMILLTTVISKPVEKYTKEMQEQLGKVNSIAQDSMGGMHILKAYNLHQVLGGKFRDAVRNTLKNSLKIEKKRSMLQPVNILIQLLPFVLCFIYGGYLSVKGQLSAGGLIAFIQLMNYITQPAGVLPGLISNMRSAAGAAGHLFDILDEETERTDGAGQSVTQSPYAIEFNRVSFFYNEQNKVLDEINFQIPRNRTAALVGSSGGGKSTVIKLICGFYQPQGGSIRILGRDISQWSLEELRAHIGVVSQDSYLFPASIAENIGYGKPGAAMEEIVAAARTAGAHEFIQALPEGYGTLVGERGANLSGGQRQRISIARAILKDAPVLLLDEPTSALDTETEDLVQTALNAATQGKTVLIIAHRFSTIRNADSILVLDNGTITGSGTHAELMESSETYRSLYLRQAEKHDAGNGSVLQEVGL